MRPEKLHMFSGVHLSYEIDMLYRTAGYLRVGQASAFNNAFVDSYALHLRNLVEFVYWKQPKDPDGLSAVDFVRARVAWLTARGRPPAVLTAANERANKQIAHFTKKRFADGAVEKQWRPSVEISALLVGLRLFLQHADPARLHSNVKGTVGRLASLVGEGLDTETPRTAPRPGKRRPGDLRKETR
jgi:hypothetical protein